MPWVYINTFLCLLGVVLIHFNSVFRILLDYPITYIIIGHNFYSIKTKRTKELVKFIYIFYLVF